MKVIKTGIAGTLESSDLMVTVKENARNEILINLKSTVAQQFGDEIKSVVLMVLKQLGINNCIAYIEDKGALDCTIIARVKTAAYRACNIKEFDWEDYNVK
jgi:citrate lyase subunit gamma (acyl carrier protein)